MRTFEITSEKFGGKVLLKFGEDDLFCGIDFEHSGCSQAQLEWFIARLPKNVNSMNYFATQQMVVAEVLESIDFDAFWDRYDDKARSSKVKTRKVWDKMSRTDQVKAYNYIARYTMNIPSGVCKKYATTYLNDQLWNN